MSATRDKSYVKSVSGSMIQRANDAMIRGKTIDDYDLPQCIKQRIRERHYSASEINAAYAKIRSE
jgi:hypothetical protein